MSPIETDICVIGAGSGGLSVAAGAVQMGARVVLIEAGEMVAIMGASGSGKSTLAKLLTRAVDVPPGTVLLGGRDVLILYVESYGRASVDVPFYADRHLATLAGAAAALLAVGLGQGACAEKGETSRQAPIRGEAAESPTEFFATAVELFFEFPGDLEKVFPEIYAVLAE